MVTRTVTIYEVPNTYVDNGTTVTITNVFTMTIDDDDATLDATAGADTGTPQILTSTAGTITSYNFIYDDSVTINGTAETVKTFQLVIGGVTRSFIMNDTGTDIPGATVGDTLALQSFANYTPVSYASIPCLAAGSRVATDKGEIPVEDLRPGMLVQTFDNGMQPIRWIGSTRLTRRELLSEPKLAPIRIEAGALGENLPLRTLTVSPQHRVLLDGWEVELNFGVDEALAPAIGLAGLPGIERVIPHDGVEYFHLLFDQHEIIFANGLPTESFFVGDTIRAGMDSEQLAEIMRLFPQLARQYGPMAGTARMVLKPQEMGAIRALAG